MRLGWICTFSPAHPGARRRCHYPILALRDSGFTSSVYASCDDPRRDLAGLDALVFVGPLDGQSLDLAAAARRANKRIYVSVGEELAAIAAMEDGSFLRLAALAGSADAVIVPHAGVRELLEGRVGDCMSIREIPEETDTRQSLREARESASRFRPPAQKLVLERLLSWFAPGTREQPGAERGAERTGLSTELPTGHKQRVVWFADATSAEGDAGMTALLRAANALERVAGDFEIELLVVSRNRAMFETCIKPHIACARHLEHGEGEPFRSLEGASVCLLPSAADADPKLRIDGRAAIALRHGVPVVASRARCHDDLAAGMAFDDWEAGLRRFLGSAEERRSAVEAARSVIEARRSRESVRKAWIALLGRERPARVPVLAVYFEHLQDVDVLLPVIDEARSGERLVVKVLLSEAIIRNSPRALRSMMARDITPLYVEHDTLKRGDARMLDGVDCLITCSESTVPAHIASHTIARLARGRGVHTFTLQHGLENAGLTYFDRAFGPEIVFASEHVLTWGRPQDLPAEISRETRVKCVAVGRTASVKATPIPRRAEWGDRAVVGIFENLHWHRYREAYRAAFAADVVALAKRRSDLVVLLKPHHTGQFLINERHRLAGAPDNLVVIDPRDASWEPYTAPALLQHCLCAITTPSSVALDAAELGVPVAVVAYDLDVPNYVPLPELRSSQSWVDFVEAMSSDRKDALQLSQRFLDRVRVPGNAAARVVALVRATALGEAPRLAEAGG